MPHPDPPADDGPPMPRQGGDLEPHCSNRQRKETQPPPGFRKTGDLDFRAKTNVKKGAQARSALTIPKYGLDESFPQTNSSTATTAESEILEPDLDRLAAEGGDKFIRYMCAQAIEHHDDLPDPTNVRNWTFRDIRRMPKGLQEEWHKACLEEIEALKKRQVYELCDLPSGQKTVKNRWVFDIKSNG